MSGANSAARWALAKTLRQTPVMLESFRFEAQSIRLAIGQLVQSPQDPVDRLHFATGEVDKAQPGPGFDAGAIFADGLLKQRLSAWSNCCAS